MSDDSRESVKYRCVPLKYLYKAPQPQAPPQKTSAKPVPDLFKLSGATKEVDPALKGHFTDLSEAAGKPSKKDDKDEAVVAIRQRNASFILIWAKVESDPDEIKRVGEIQYCFDSLKPCLSAMQTLSKDKKEFVNLIFLSQIAVKLVTSVYLGLSGNFPLRLDKNFLEEKAELIKHVQVTRLQSKNVLENSDLPVGSWNVALSRLDLGLRALPNPTEGKEALKAGLKILKGAAEAAASWKLNKTLVEGVTSLATLGTAKLIQKQAEHVFKLVAMYEYYAAYYQCEILKPSSRDVDRVKEELIRLQTDAIHESRWEVLASFVDVLASAVLGDGTGEFGKTIHAIPPNFLKWIVEGEGDFFGLKGFSSFGEDLPVAQRLESGCDVPIVALDRWASKVLDMVRMDRMDGRSVKNGAEMAQAQIEAGLQSLQDLLLESLQKVAKLAEKELASLVQQPFSTAFDKVRKEQPDLTEAVKKLEAVERGLSKARKMVGGVEVTVKSLLDAFSKAVTVAEQASSFLSKINSFFGSGDQGVTDLFKQEMRSGFVEIKKSLLEELGRLSSRRLPDSFPEKPSFDDEKSVVEFFKEFSFSQVGTEENGNDAQQMALLDVLDVAVRCMTAYATVKTVADSFFKGLDGQTNSSEVNDESQTDDMSATGLFDEFVERVSEFRKLVQGQHALKQHALQELQSLTRNDKKYKEQKQQRQQIADDIFKQAQKNFDAARIVFDEVVDTCKTLNTNLKDAKLNDQLSEPGSGTDTTPPTEPPQLGQSHSLGLLAHRLEWLVNSLKVVQRSSKALQDVVLSETNVLKATHAIKNAEQMVTECKSKIEAVHACKLEWETAKEAAKEAAKKEAAKKPSNSPDQKKQEEQHEKHLNALQTEMEQVLFSLQLKLFGWKLQSVGQTNTRVEHDKESLAGILSELSTRGVALLSDCTNMIKSCNEVTGGKNLVFTANRMVPLLSAVVGEDLKKEKEKMLQDLQDVKSDLVEKAQEMVGSAWKEIKDAGQGISKIAEEYKELEDECGVLRGAVDFGRGLFEMVKSNVQSRSKTELWRVRDRALYQLMAVRAALQTSPPKDPDDRNRDDDEVELEEDGDLAGVRKYVERMIVRRRALEQVPGISNTLQSENFMQAMADVVAAGCQDENALQEEIADRMKLVIELEDELMTEKDPVKKKAGLITLHKEKTALNNVMDNVKDMNTKFSVLKSTLDQMTKQLEVINQKLDTLIDVVKEMADDIHQLLGESWATTMKKHRARHLNRGKDMRHEVYIEPHCSDKNPEFKGRLLMEVATQEFLLKPDKGCMLVSGLAGSGKSVFASKLEQYILGQYYQKRFAEEGKTVVLIWANLPSLKNPLTGLFEEALQRYHLSPLQVRLLRDEIQKPDSKVEPVFVLDGYDELRPEFLFRNLYKTNNLESYRPRREPTEEKEKKKLYSFPKVIFLCREELLASNPNYAAAFLPLESLNVDKDEPHEASEYFVQVEIGLLDSSKFEEYAREYVALNVRSAFVDAFPSYKIEAEGQDWEDDDVLNYLILPESAVSLSSVKRSKKPKDGDDAMDGGDAVSPASVFASELRRMPHELEKRLYYADDVGSSQGGMYADNANDRDRNAKRDEEMLKLYSLDMEREKAKTLKKEVEEAIEKKKQLEEAIKEMKATKRGEGGSKNADKNKAAKGKEKEQEQGRPSKNQVLAEVWPIEKLVGLGGLFGVSQKESQDATNKAVGCNKELVDKRDKAAKEQLKVLAKSLAAPLKPPSPDSKKTLTGLRTDLRVFLNTIKAAHGPLPAGGVGAAEAAGGVGGGDNVSGSGVAGAMVPGGAGDMMAGRQPEDTGQETAEDERLVSDMSVEDLELKLMFKLLICVSSGKNSSSGTKSEEDFYRFQQEVDHRRLWLADRIVREYRQLPELAELTKTPFMIKIVVKILPLLKELTATISSLKQELILRLNESMADVAWAALQKRNLVSTESRLKEVQDLIDLEKDHRWKDKDALLFRDFLRDQIDLTLMGVVDDVNERKRQDEKLNAEAAGMTDDYIHQQLKRSLMRRPVRRYLIYYEFMKNYAEQEQEKLSSRAKSIAPGQLLNEFWEYSQRLAVKMTSDVLTKVTYSAGSLIFSDAASNEWNDFFGAGDQRQQVRRVAPIKSQHDTYSFVHKSVQEFFVAMNVRDSVVQLVKETLIPLPTLREMLDNVAADARTSAELSLSKMQNSGFVEGTDDIMHVSAEEMAVKDILNALASDTKGKAAERKRQAKAILKLIQRLLDGPLNTVDLSGEEAVRDFLLDTLLDDIQVASSFGAVASLCSAERLHQGKLRFVADNLRLLFTAPMPKRKGNTLVHITCQPGESNKILLDSVLGFCLDANAGDRQGWDWRTVLLTKNKQGLAPLMICLEEKNWEMGSLLLEHCANDEVREQVIVDCTTREVKMDDLKNDSFVLQSGEKMFVESGKAYFQVTINLSELKIRQMKLSSLDASCKMGFAGTLAVGFAAGKVPLEKKMLQKMWELFQSGYEPGTTESSGNPGNKKTAADFHDSAKEFEKNFKEDGWKSSDDTSKKNSGFGRNKTNNTKQGETQQAKWLSERRKERNEITRQQTRTCPLGGASTLGFHSVTGLAIHVVEPFDNLAKRLVEKQGHEPELEFFSEKIIVPAPRQEDEGEELGSLKSASTLPLFPAERGGRAAQQGAKPDGTPGQVQQAPRGAARRANQARPSLKLNVLDPQNEFAYLGLAIDFQQKHDSQMVVSCCWNMRKNAGAWTEVARVDKMVGPMFFPVLCVWGLPVSCTHIDLGDSKGHTPFRIEPPHGGLDFQQYEKAVRGVAGHYRMAQKNEWALFRNLLEQGNLSMRFNLLTYLDPDSGMTLLHSLVEEASMKAKDTKQGDQTPELDMAKKKVQKLLDTAKALLRLRDGQGIADKSVEDMILKKDTSGFSAFSLVARTDVAKVIMRNVKDPTKKAYMLNQLVNRVYLETGDLPGTETANDNLFEMRLRVVNDALEYLNNINNKGEPVVDNLLRKARKVRENPVFFRCVLKAFSNNEEGKQSTERWEAEEEAEEEDEEEEEEDEEEEEELMSFHWGVQSEDGTEADSGAEEREAASERENKASARELCAFETADSEGEDVEQERSARSGASKSHLDSASEASSKDRDSVPLDDHGAPYYTHVPAAEQAKARSQEPLMLGAADEEATERSSEGLLESEVGKVDSENEESEEGSDSAQGECLADVAAFFIVPLLGRRAMEMLGGGAKKIPTVLELALRTDPGSLGEAPPEIQAKGRWVERAVEYDGLALKHSKLNEKAENFRNIVKKAVESNGLALKHAKSALQKDKDIVMAAVKNNGMALEHAADELKGDVEVVEEAAQQNFTSLQFADWEKLQTSNTEKIQDIVRGVVAMDGMALAYVPTSMMKRDPSLVKSAVSRSGRAILYAPKEFKEDTQVVRKALESDAVALMAVGTHQTEMMENSENRDLMLGLVEKNFFVLNVFPDDLLQDKQVQARAWVSHPDAVMEIARIFEDRVYSYSNIMYALNDLMELLGHEDWDENEPCKDPVKVWSCVLFAVMIFEIQRRAESEESEGIAMDAEIGENQSMQVQKLCEWLSPVKDFPCPEPAEGMVAAALEWKNGKGKSTGELRLSQCWLFLVQLLDRWMKDEPESEQKDAAEALHKLVRELIEEGEFVPGEVLKYASLEDKNDRELVEKAIRKSDGTAFEFADQSLRGDLDVAKIAVKMAPMALKHVKFTPEQKGQDSNTPPATDYKQEYLKLALEAVKVDGMALRCVGKQQLPDLANFGAIAAEAVNQNGLALQYEPHKECNPKLIQLAMCKNWQAIEFVPPTVTREDWFEKFILEQELVDGMALEYLPIEKRDNKRVVGLAVSKNGNALQFASLKWREDPDLCCLAVKNDPLALRFVESGDFLNNSENLEMIKEAVQKHGCMLEYAPHSLGNDIDTVTSAIKSDILALQFAYVADTLNAEILKSLIEESLKRPSRYHFELPRSLDIFAHHVDIDHRNKTIDFKDYASVVCPRMIAVRGCRLYYEVEIIEFGEEPWMQFGFADQTFNPLQEDSEDSTIQGVGDAPGSWAVDGMNRFFWTGTGAEPEKWAMTYGPWKEGAWEGVEERDVLYFQSETATQFRIGTKLGMLCDPLRGTISFWANDTYLASSRCKDYRNAMEGVEFIGPGLFPALSGKDVKVRYNLGEPSEDKGVGLPATKELKKFQFSDNPLAKSHNMEEWFFRVRSEPEAVSDKRQEDRVLQTLTKEALEEYVVQGTDRHRALDRALSTKSSEETEVRITVELKCKPGSFDSMAEHNFRAVVADKAGVGAHQVNTRVVAGNGTEDSVNVDVSVKVPAHEAEFVASMMSTGSLNQRVLAQGVKNMTVVKVTKHGSETKEEERRQEKLQKGFTQNSELTDWPHVDEVPENEGSRYVESLQQSPSPQAVHSHRLQELPAVIRLNEPFDHVKHERYAGERAGRRIEFKYIPLGSTEIEQAVEVDQAYRSDVLERVAAAVSSTLDQPRPVSTVIPHSLLAEAVAAASTPQPLSVSARHVEWEPPASLRSPQSMVGLRSSADSSLRRSPTAVESPLFRHPPPQPASASAGHMQVSPSSNDVVPLKRPNRPSSGSSTPVASPGSRLLTHDFGSTAPPQGNQLINSLPPTVVASRPSLSNMDGMVYDNPPVRRPGGSLSSSRAAIVPQSAPVAAPVRHSPPSMFGTMPADRDVGGFATSPVGRRESDSTVMASPQHGGQALSGSGPASLPAYGAPPAVAPAQDVEAASLRYAMEQMTREVQSLRTELQDAKKSTANEPYNVGTFLQAVVAPFLPSSPEHELPGGRGGSRGQAPSRPSATKEPLRQSFGADNEPQPLRQSWSAENEPRRVIHPPHEAETLRRHTPGFVLEQPLSAAQRSPMHLAAAAQRSPAQGLAQGAASSEDGALGWFSPSQSLTGSPTSRAAARPPSVSMPAAKLAFSVSASPPASRTAPYPTLPLGRDGVPPSQPVPSGVRRPLSMNPASPASQQSPPPSGSPGAGRTMRSIC